MALSRIALTAKIAASLNTHGVPMAQAGNVARAFVDNLKRDHPAWFEEPVSLADFVEHRINEHLSSANPFHPVLLEVVRDYRQAQRDVENSEGTAANDFFSWTRLAHLATLRRLAGIWSDHPDYNRTLEGTE